MAALPKFHGVSPTFYRDPKVRSWSDDGQKLALYLLVCPERSSEGLYRLPLVNALDDLRWERERFDRALAEISDFASYDDKAQIVFIRRALRFNKVGAGTQTEGALRKLDEAKGSPHLFEEFLARADKYQADFAKAIRQRYSLDGPKGQP